MTIEKLLENITDIQKINASTDNNYYINNICIAVIEDLKKDIAHAAAKKGGKLNAQKAAEKILKQGDAIIRPILQYAPVIDDIQYISNGYLVIALSKPLQLPEPPDNLEPLPYKKFLDGSTKNITLSLPDLAQLKAYYKIQKAQHKHEKKYRCFYDFGVGLPCVDVDFLISMMEILPGAVATCSERWQEGIYFKDFENNSGLLLPVRPPEGITRQTTNIYN